MGCHGWGGARRGAHLAGVVPLGDVIDAVEESLRLDRLGPEPGLAKGLGLLRDGGKGRGDPVNTFRAKKRPGKNPTYDTMRDLTLSRRLMVERV